MTDVSVLGLQVPGLTNLRLLELGFWSVLGVILVMVVKATLGSDDEAVGGTVQGRPFYCEEDNRDMLFLQSPPDMRLFSHQR